MGRKRAISEELKEHILKRLNKHVEKKYVGKFGVKGISTKFKGRYLYIDWIEGLTEDELKKMWKGFNEDQMEILVSEQLKRYESRPQKLCRLYYTDDIEYWGFELYKYSDGNYDQEGDYPYPGGTIEKCFDEAAKIYIMNP